MSENDPPAPEFVAPALPVEPAPLLTTLENGTKVKRRIPRMRACDERNDKGKMCHGHLKRWFAASPEMCSRFGDELYRCEKCHTVWLPATGEPARTRTMQW